MTAGRAKWENIQLDLRDGSIGPAEGRGITEALELNICPTMHVAIIYLYVYDLTKRKCKSAIILRVYIQPVYASPDIIGCNSNI